MQQRWQLLHMQAHVQPMLLGNSDALYMMLRNPFKCSPGHIVVTSTAAGGSQIIHHSPNGSDEEPSTSLEQRDRHQEHLRMTMCTR